MYVKHKMFISFRVLFLGSVEGGWDVARAGLAKRYRDGGYPDMATFIETVH